MARCKLYMFSVAVIILFSSTLFASPEGVLDLSNKADQLFEQMAYTDAESLYLKVLENEPLPKDLRSSTLFHLGLLYFYTNNIEKANQYIREAIESDKTNTEFREHEEKIRHTLELLRDAQRELAQNELEQASETLSKIVSSQPKYAEAWFLLGQTYLRLGDYKLASEYLNKAISMNPQNEKYINGKYALAAKLYNEGLIEFKRRNLEVAMEQFQKSIKIDSTFASSWYMMGVIHNMYQQYDQAIEYYLKAIDSDSTNPTSYFGLGNAYLKTGNTDKALNAYKKATDADPNYIKAWSAQGVIWLKQKQYREALKAYQKAIAIDPNYTKAYQDMGICYQELGELEKAAQKYEKAVMLDPRSYTTFTRLATVYNELMQFDKSKKAAGEALKIKSNYAPAYIELGYAEKGLGNRTAAIAAFRKASNDRKWSSIAQYELKLLNAQ